MTIALTTTSFRRQHAELGTHAAAVLEALKDPAAIEVDSHAVRRLLAVLAGKLKVHAAMEDEALYPRLFEHADTDMRQLARRFRNEFGGVYTVFLAFIAQWGGPEIEARPVEFAEAARNAMVALGARVKSENEELYEAVDALERAEAGGATSGQ